MSNATPESEMSRFEQALGALVPTPPRIDRDRLFFQAGLRQAGRGRFAVPAATGAMTLALGLVLGAFVTGFARPGVGETQAIMASKSTPPVETVHDTEVTVADPLAEERDRAEERALLARLRAACPGWDEPPGPARSDNQTCEPPTLQNLGRRFGTLN